MKALGSVCHVLAAVAVVAAIWSPVGAWWQFLATALLLFLVGALVLGLQAQKVAAHDLGEQTIPLRDGEVLSSTGDPDLDRAINTPISDADVRKYRRTYGRKADR
ncbi:hypothetical protein [Brachybacterium paraconglomeratum]|uniref:hypothetical protein n=1 Tax=Brachybacterium paraconglomeratum TaxID=173362 RepID=UPI0022AFEDB0|nr:hypothetical protein [Brachybacterium paraconglomeratum]MCZ4325695.1 hypothetical protein [Brachybacterium paraconglomeratum]